MRHGPRVRFSFRSPYSWMIPVATARILHRYARYATVASEAKLVRLDDEVVCALTGGRP